MDELLLDTTYLLPVFGLSVELKNFDVHLKRLLSTYSTLYNPASLMEAKWITLKLTRRNPVKKEILLKAYRAGIRALIVDERFTQTPLTNDTVESIADELASEDGVKDYFDRLIYGTAAQRNCILLTEDSELRRLKKRRPSSRPKQVLNWDEITEQ